MPKMKLAAITVLMISLAMPVSAEKVIWFGQRTEDGASLIYGTPDSGYGKIVFSCAAGQEELSFIYEHEPASPEDGNEVDVILSAGDQEISIPTTGTRLESDDLYILEGQATLDKRLRDILTSAGTLTVTVEDGSAEYPLDGAADAARSLLQICSPDA